jgi:hypothetical protein
VVDRVRELLQQIEHGVNPAAAQQQLDDIFALKDKASTFGYLQVVNPPVYAELMQAKLDPASPGEPPAASSLLAVLFRAPLAAPRQAAGSRQQQRCAARPCCAGCWELPCLLCTAGHHPNPRQPNPTPKLAPESNFTPTASTQSSGVTLPTGGRWWLPWR